jgi:hypothetical protein
MTTEAATFTRRIEGQDRVYEAYSKPGTLERFRNFIEYSDWDEAIVAQGRRIDILCSGVLIIAAFYFVPLLWNMLISG